MDVEEVFRQHGDALFRYLARECGDPQLAQDAVQEAFLRLQERGPRNLSGVRAWLFRTGRNVVRDESRRSVNRRRLMARNPDRIPGPSPSASPKAGLERRDDLERLRRALDELREKERTALLLRESGFSHREIAEELNTTTGTVGTLIARSLRKLAEAMERNGGME